ncbi:MAG: hypothetical protein PVF90_04530 [Gemmatimonadota bacterium]
METFLGIPARGWIALSIWVLVLTIPWAYVLWFLRRIDRSGVARWGAKTGKADGVQD